MENDIIEKIQKLLALATSPNEYEARLATEKANELLIKYNLKMQDVASYDADDFIDRVVDDFDRSPVEFKFICPIIQLHFFVGVYYNNIVNGPKALRFVGTATNVAIATYMFEFLNRKFKLLWGMYVIEFDAPTTSKQSFYLGLKQGILEQLTLKRAAVEQEAGLVVVTDPRIKQALAHMSTMRSSVDSNDISALIAGQAEGASLKLTPGLPDAKSGQSGKFLK